MSNAEKLLLILIVVSLLSVGATLTLRYFASLPSLPVSTFIGKYDLSRFNYKTKLEHFSELLPSIMSYFKYNGWTLIKLEYENISYRDYVEYISIFKDSCKYCSITKESKYSGGIFCYKKTWSSEAKFTTKFTIFYTYNPTNRTLYLTDSEGLFKNLKNILSYKEDKENLSGKFDYNSLLKTLEKLLVSKHVKVKKIEDLPNSNLVVETTTIFQVKIPEYSFNEIMTSISRNLTQKYEYINYDEQNHRYSWKDKNGNIIFVDIKKQGEFITLYVYVL